MLCCGLYRVADSTTWFQYPHAISISIGQYTNPLVLTSIDRNPARLAPDLEGLSSGGARIEFFASRTGTS